jgi:hypothetical protein
VPGGVLRDQLAEEWTYRFPAAARAWASTEHTALQHISPASIDLIELHRAPAAPQPSTAEAQKVQALDFEGRISR